MFFDVGEPTLRRIPDEGGFQYTDDGYPDVVFDQRHGYGCTTRDEVETFWIETLARADRAPHVQDPMAEAVPYINRSRWLTDCPACNAGNYAWDQNPLVCCLDCGLLAKVLWQAPLDRSRAIRLLAVREVVNRNWNAHKGETVDELEVENRWLLDEPSTVKAGLVVPVGLNVPDALEKYTTRLG